MHARERPRQGRPRDHPKKFLSDPELLLRFRIAWQFGCTVAELGVRVSSLELAAWDVYLRHFADLDQDRRAGEIAAAVFNSQGAKLRGKHVAADFFFPRLKPPPAEPVRQTPEEIARAFGAIPDFGTV